MPAVAIAAATATVLVTRGSTAPLTSYASASAAAHAADLVAGLGLAAAGLVAWGETRTRRVGLLALCAAIAWLAPEWEGWVQGPSLVRSTAALLAPFVPALVVHIALAAPGGHLATRRARITVAAGYGATLGFVA